MKLVVFSLMVILVLGVDGIFRKRGMYRQDEDDDEDNIYAVKNMGDSCLCFEPTEEARNDEIIDPEVEELVSRRRGRRGLPSLKRLLTRMFMK